MNPLVKKDHDERIRKQLMDQLGAEICALLDDPTVIEIMLNPNGELRVDRLGKKRELFGRMPEFRARSLIGTVASCFQLSITAQNPILECELPLDGSRFEAIIPPVVSGPTFTIRKRAIMVFTLEDYVRQGIMTETQRSLIKVAALARDNILIVGGTGSGKTTLTNAVMQYMVDMCPEHRFVVLEDTRELQCSAKDAVLLRAVEHADMTRLLKATMRLIPDRIVVGEVRDGAAHAMLKAWNTGHPGGVATLHANSAHAGLIRMEQLVAEATHAPMQALIGEAIDLVVFIEKCSGGRKVKEVLRVSGYDGHNYITQSAGG